MFHEASMSPYYFFEIEDNLSSDPTSGCESFLIFLKKTIEIDCYG